MSRSFTLGGRSIGATWVVFRQVFPSRVTATRIASLLSAACMGMGFLVFTRSTLTPLDNIGVMTMKIMSITSITSTMEVTLISDTGANELCFMITDAAFSFAIVSLPGIRQEAGSPEPELPRNQLAELLVTDRAT